MQPGPFYSKTETTADATFLREVLIALLVMTFSSGMMVMVLLQ
jgi:hypothetical protein